MAFELARGTVTSVIPFLNLYFIQIENGPTVTAKSAMHSSTGLSGPRELNLLQPGDWVLLARQQSSPATAIIIGTLPFPVETAGAFLPDEIVPTSNVGWRSDEIYQFMHDRYPDLTALKNFNQGRPIDQLPGDVGYLNEFGIGYGLSQSMAWFKSSDICGLWAFYQDHLLRLAGYNYELWTAGAERWYGNDEGEYNEIEQSTPYPWEALGQKTPGAPVSIDNEENIWKRGQLENYREPAEPDQSGIFRYHNFKGFLGDLHRQMVTAPDFQAPSIEKYSTTSPHFGLSEIVEGIDGTIAIRSAKQVVIEKYVLIPAPKKLARPDDTEGDTVHVELLANSPEAYPSAGFTKYPDTAYTVNEFGWAEETTANFRAAQLFDAHAYLFNYQLPQSLIRHTKDWLYPQESNIPDPVAGAAIPDFENMGSKFMAALPPKFTLKLDHRSDGVTYYRSRSSIHLVDDGSVVIEDGYGSQIIMGGGNITFSCPGDIIQRPGRDAVIMAPNDVVLRAGNSLDATAAKGDLRLKAENNLHALAGNSGSGGVLIESRATDNTMDFSGSGSDVKSSGITLETRGGTIRQYANQIYLRTINSGDINIDADETKGNLNLIGNNITSFANQGIIQALGPEDERWYSIFTANSWFLHVPQIIAKTNQMILSGSSSDDSTLLVNGNIANKNPNPGPLSAGQATQIGTAVDAIKNQVDSQGKSVSKVVDNLTQSGMMGNEDYIRVLGFSLRNTKQYGLGDDFILPEARWQQLARLTKVTMPTWNEPAVEIPGRKTLGINPPPQLSAEQSSYPFPGLLWLQKQFMQIDMNLFDPNKGYDVDRGTDSSNVYSQGTAAKTTAVTFDNYMVTKQGE